MKIVQLVTLTLLGLVLGSCSSTPAPRLDDLPPVTKHPYHAGIYYSPGFKSAQSYERYQRGGSTIEVGAASVLMLDELLPRLFEKTSVVKSLSAEEARQKGVDLILVPSLESFQLVPDMARGRNMAPLHMSYRFTLWSKDGLPGPSWTIHSLRQSSAADAPRVGGRSDGTFAAETMERAARRILYRLQYESAAVTKVATGTVPRNLAPPARIQISAVFQGLQHAQRTGLLPIFVRASSEDSRTFQVRPSDMQLRLPTGEILQPLSVSEVVSVVDRTRSFRRASTESNFDWMSFILLGAIQSTPSYASMADQEAARREFFAERTQISRQLEDRSFTKSSTVLGGKSSEGFLFFRLPVKASFEKVTLSGWIMEVESTTPAAFEVAVNAESAEGLGK